MTKKNILLKSWINITDSIDQDGPDGGIALFAYELPKIGRIDIEKKTRQKEPKEYFAVTIVIYGRLLHTGYFYNWDDVLEHLNSTQILMQIVFNNQSS
jgi:hypothetical protein